MFFFFLNLTKNKMLLSFWVSCQKVKFENVILGIFMNWYVTTGIFVPNQKDAKCCFRDKFENLSLRCCVIVLFYQQKLIYHTQELCALQNPRSPTFDCNLRSPWADQGWAFWHLAVISRFLDKLLVHPLIWNHKHVFRPKSI